MCIRESLRTRLHICVNELDDWYFDDDICRRTLQEQFHAATMEGLGIADYNCGTIAAGALFQYLHETQKSDLSHMNSITPYVTCLLYTSIPSGWKEFCCISDFLP